MNAKIDLFEKNQMETRCRVDYLSKVVIFFGFSFFLTSIAVYLFQSKEQSSLNVFVINVTWWLLVLSIVFAILTLYTIILRDYYLGETLRPELGSHSANHEVIFSHKKYDFFILIFGHIGVYSFLMGILCFVYFLSKSIHVT